MKGNKRFEKEKGEKRKKSGPKGDPVKGTSSEYEELANSDEDDDIVDVSDMLEKEDDNEIPLINSKRAKEQSASSKFSTGNRFNALGEYEEIQEDEQEPPKKKMKKDSDEEEEDSDAPAPEAEASEESEDDDEEERLKFRAEIASMPLGKVKEMKEKLGIKLFNKTYFGTSEVEKQKKLKKKKTLNEVKSGQHRPKEISSKRPVSSFRNIYGDHEKGQKKK